MAIRKEIKDRLAKSFRATMHTMHNMAWHASKTGEFTLAQYRVLMLALEKGPMTISEFVKFMGVAQSTASEMVDRLVCQGYLLKKKSDQDRRKTIFELSAKAHKVLAKRRQEMELIYERVLSRLSEEDQIKLVEAFETIEKLLIVEKSDL